MNIIRPDIYEASSLQQTVQELCDTKIEVTDDKLINLVTKYFFAYFYPEAAEYVVALRAIEDLFEKCGLYFAILFAAMKLGREISRDSLQNHTNIFIYDHEYGVAMLGDVAPTVAIVKDIISRKLEATLTGRHYNGLDLWSGTGILLLAQYIQARRNDYRSIHNIGIEQNAKSSQAGDTLISRLGAGHIMSGDSTDVQMYKLIGIQWPISHVSNETIPTTWYSMGNKSDPFYENLRALYAALYNYLTPQTQFFPQKMSVNIRVGSWDNIQEVMHSNERYLEQLFQMQTELENSKELQLSDKRHIYQHIYPLSIQLHDVLVPMHQVGNDILQTGKVNKPPIRKYRRDGKNTASLANLM